LTSLGILVIFPLFGAVVDEIGFTSSFWCLAGLLFIMRILTLK
jgi:hypothetical protein